MRLLPSAGVLRLCAWGGLALTIVRPAQADAVDDYVKRRMAREHIPGLSLVVIRNGRIVKAKGYGRASLEHDVPARPDTVYELASTTKPFVAAAVLLLVQDRKLALEDRVSRFIENAPESWKEITLRHLLSHTSGIKDYLSDLNHDFPQDTPPEPIVKAAMDAPLNFAPGAKWAYSNTGYVLLGMIVQKVSGKSYDAFLQERVFNPLGMADTRRDTPDGVVPRRATGYLWYGGAFHNAEFLKFMMTNHGDRGILSTALDLAKWDAALASNRILTPASQAAMWTPVIHFDGGYTYPFSYGLGWFIKSIHGHRQLSHPGGAPGAGAILSRYPDDGLTVILLANGGRAFMQALDLGVARQYIPGLAAARPVKLRPALLNACTGYYNAYGSQLLTAVRDGPGLFLDDGGGVNNEFLPVSDNRFVAEEADRAFTVTRDANGGVAGATLRLGKDEMAVQRLGPLAHTLRPQPDPAPALTREIEAVLRAFASGGKPVEETPFLAPQARKDYAHGPAPELAGMMGISYVAGQDVAAQGIQRHGAKVSRVLYYKLLAGGGSHFVLVYLTAEGLVTDQDVVAE
jgi:CubicO group peptidase (beta-lactamase class C family)